MNQIKLLGKRYLIVGGTDGIGKATALHLASKGADITIVGRSVEKANAAIERMKSARLEESQKFDFESLDVTNIKQVYRFCENVSGTLDGVVLCAGGLNFGPRRVTKEGVEMTFAQNYLSRFVFMKYLALKSLRIVHCLAAGNGSSIQFNDIQLETSSMVPFFLRAASQYAMMGDVIVKELAKRLPNQAQFFHYFPGVVNTNASKNQGFPFIIHYVGSWILPLIADSPETVAQRIVHLLNSKEFEEKSLNGSLVGPKCNLLPLKEKDPLAGEKLWTYTEDLVNKLINK